MLTILLILAVIAIIVESISLYAISANNDKLRQEIDDCKRPYIETIRTMGNTIEQKKSTIVQVAAERDKWQVEAAKRGAIVQRQANDILRLEMSLKTRAR